MQMAGVMYKQDEYDCECDQSYGYGDAPSDATGNESGWDGEQHEEQRQYREKCGAVTYLQAEVILCVKCEERFHGRVTDEPEENGKQDSQPAFILVADHFAQAFDDTRLLFSLFHIPSVLQ